MARAEQILERAEERIEQCRKGELSIEVTAPDGRPMPGRKVELRQERSRFLFGCNIFELEPESESEEQRLYQERFRRLLNYATLPFYWGSYEPEPGRKSRERLERMARWCADNGIRTKGHPLVWHEVYPEWADRQARSPVELLRERVTEIVGGFAGLVDMWDVINESTVSHRFDNGVGVWARQAGMVEMAAETMRWARAANPEATLLVNDYNISPQYEEQIEGLLEGDGRPDVIGIQSHMHRSEWTIERAWEVCETYARFGLPLHFTETTVLSGAHIPEGASTGRYRPQEWPTTAEGELRQVEYVEKFYTVLFSHPAVEAITWWDLRDGCWMNAPAGLLRRDLSPKPAYDRLLDLITRQWRTNADLSTGDDGRARATAFYGSYVATDTESGRSVRFEHAPETPANVTLALS